MDPAEFDTPEGQVRWRILRAMFQAAASQAHWIGTLSNWALGTTGIYIGLVVTNFDTVSRHLAAESQMPQIFWFALASAVVGIGIQVLWGFAQAALNVEDRMWAVLLPEIANAAGKDPDYISRIINPVLDEFINSRPPLFRRLARWGKKKGAQDLVMVSKSAATIAQLMFAFLFIQYILLAAAIFWPLGVITLTPNRPAIGSLSTTPTPIGKVSVSPKPSPPARTTWIP
jgi:hypothetical protein